MQFQKMKNTLVSYSQKAVNLLTFKGSKKAFLLIFLSIITIGMLKAQYSTTHYIPPSPWTYNNNANELEITTLSTTPVSVTISTSDGTVINNSLTTVSGTPLSYRFTPVGVSANALNAVLNGKGLIISASTPIGVQVRNIASDNVTCSGTCYGGNADCSQKGNSSFTSLGDQGLGTSFRIGYYANVTGMSCNSESAAPVYGFMARDNGTNLYLNGKLVTTLSAGQSYLLQAAIGSEVTSNNLVVGTSGMRIDNSSGCGDGVCSQLIPEAYLGTSYIVVRSSGNTGYERSTIVATQANTKVTVVINGGSTTIYTLTNAGDNITINNGDGSTTYSSCYVSATLPVAVYTGSASGCEIDMIVQPPLSNCAGSFDVQTTKFVSNANTGNSALPYFGYILVESDTAKVYFNGVDLETLTSKRTAVANSSFYIIQFTNTQLGNPTNLNFVVNARINVAMVESGGGYSMSSFISSIANTMPPPSITSNCLPSTFTAQSGFASYQWYKDGTLITGVTSQVYSPSLTGNYSVAGNSLTCGTTVPSPTVAVNSKPNAGIDISACAGNVVTLTGTNPTTDTWIVQAGNPTGATLGNTTNGVAAVTLTGTANGTYNFIYSAGCSDTMSLLVNAPTTSSTSTSICAGNSYTFNGTAYTTSGTYTVHLTNKAGCDSAATLILTVKPTSTSTITKTICTGSSYTFNGTAYSASGTYTVHLTNSVGCDSAAILVLTVNPTSTSTTNASFCTGSSYTFNGTAYSTAGTYTVHLTNSVGCDSAATLILTQKSTSSSSTAASICSGGSYLFNGVSYTTTGTYVAHLSNSVGCDSAATLVLTVKSLSTSTTNATISTGNSYLFNGTSYNNAGSYTVHLTNSVGCDSAATLVLTVVSLSNTVASICSGSSYLFNGISYTSSGTYTAHLTSKSGYDSIATLVLTVKPTSTSTTNASICSGSSYIFNGNTYTNAGTYVEHLTNSVGCDSAATLVLTVKATSSSTTNASICPGGSYTFNGTAYNIAGSYTAHLTNKVGCDSAATLILVIKSTSVSTTNATICSGASYTFNGTAYTSAGVYTAHLTNSVGCDSAATLVLTVKSTSSSTTTASICSGSTYTFNGTAYSSSGTYTVHFTNSLGCDSSAILILTVNANPTVAAITGTSTICQGSPLVLSNTTAGGVWTSGTLSVASVNNSGSVTTTGSGTSQITYTVTSSAGCTTAVSKTITVNPVPSVAAISGNSTLCTGSTTTLTNSTFGGTWSSSNTGIASISTAGVVTGIAAGNTNISYSLSTAANCTTTVNAPISVGVPTTSTTNATVCNGTSYLFNGILYSIAGSYTIHLTNTGGCDSAATLVLTVKAISTSTTNLSICPSVLPYTWNGLTFNAAGTQTAHLTNSVGCDSAATLVLTVKATSTSTTTASICSGTSYTFNGTAYNTAGTYTYHTTNSVGCDSAASLVLTVKVTSTSITNLSICPSALPYTWSGLTFNAAGTQTAHLTNAVGCDSAASLVLTVKATSTSTTNLSICPSVLPYTWNGLTFNAAGTQTAHLTNAVGCDSAATLVLTVKATSTSTTTASICSGTSYTFNGTAYSTAGTYTYHTTNAVGCDSAASLVLTVKATSTSTTNLSICPSALPYTWNSLTFNAAGTQTAHLINALGCDSAATLVLTVKATSTSTTIASICSGTSYTFNGTAYSTAGTYTYHTTNAVGCDSAASLVLTVKVTSTSATNLSICPSALPYIWNGLTFNAAGTQTAHLTNAVGCDSAATLVLTVKATSTSTTTASICSGTSYTFNGTAYSTAGTYTYHTTNAVGCDSAASLVLTVKATSTSTTNLSICPSALPYTWNGLTFNAAGTQTAHLTNAVGCDSAATLVLSVKATSTSTTNASICSGTTYTFNGTAYNTGGTYVYHTTNAVGCDSAASLVISIKATSTSTTNLSICPSALPYTWNGLTFNAAGTQTAHLTNAVGCDSAASLVLTVKATSTSTTTASICSGTSYTFNGTAYSTAGTYTYHTTNAVGCDSAASLVLTVKATSTSTTNLSICPSALPYTWNGLTFNAAGTQTAHLTNAVGCDSAATLVLTVKVTSTSTTTASICSGTSYTFNGTAYSTAGTYTYHTTNSVGCDSAASLVLIVKATSTSNTNLSICPSALPYIWNGLTFNAAGTQTAHLTNAVGCDSAATLVLTVKATSTSTTNFTACSSYTWNGSTYTTSGTYTYSTTNASGCDSTATLNLIVNYPSTSSTNVTACSSYTWNGTTYTTSGTYTYSTTNTLGCDSTATLNLVVNYPSTSITNVTACSSYTWNGSTYTTSGTYTYSTTNALGCDSTATLNLIVNYPSTSSTNVTACSSYTWNGTLYTTSGTYTFSTTNALGCDSIATLNLTVNYPSTSSTNVTACSSYTWNGTTYTTSGTYTYSTTNALGCDSTATLNLTVNYPSTSNANVTACSSYTWNGTTYNTSGTYTYSTTNALGCDSTATLNLTVNYPSTSSTNVTACSSYTWNGTAYTTSGTYTYSTTNASGCDSIATLNLVVNYPSTSSTNITACSSYTWNGIAYTTSGTYTYSTTNALGCDSTATLNLTVNYPSTSSTNVTACSSYTWNGSTYTTSGTYTYSTTNALGCDSTATLNLIVNYPSTSSTNVTACSSYTWNGTLYTTSGTYTYSTTNASVCDSTATLNLTVNYSTTSSTNITACSSYTWNGTTYTTSGTYSYSSTNTLGCDSIATLNLTINNPSVSTTNVTACSSYAWNGITYTTSGTYTYSTTNASGCDSTATLNLTVNYPSTSSTNVTACSSYTWNGTVYTTSGIYTYSTLNALGCDSTATLNLTVNYPSTSSTNITACSSYTWNGTTYNTSGTYTYSTTNASGCDSTATLNLIVNYPSTSSTNVTACSSYTWNSTTYTTSGTYTYSTTNASGCDSTATLNLTVNYPSTSSTNVTACSSYTWNGTTIATSGTYTYSTTNASGCDSTATLNLIVNYPSTSSTNVTACSSYIWNGTTFTTSGTYTYSTTNASGCDSTATLNLTVNYPSTSSTNVTACSSYTWNGTAYTTSGTYTYSTTNASGCDSIATLNLVVNYPSTSSTNITACSSYTWNGIAYTTSGTYTYSTTNALGCDSTATLNLTVNYPSTSSTNVTACSSYTWNGTAYTTSGTYTYSTTNALGCDSTATLNLTVNYPSTSSTNVTACSSYTWNGTAYTTSGTYTYSTTNALGCDSTATLNLIVNYPSTSSTNVTSCSSYTWNGTAYTTSGTYTYSTTNTLGCDSISTLNLTINKPSVSIANVTTCNSYTWNGITYTTSGTYTYHSTNASGCDSTATLNLSISNGTSSTTNASICNGSSYSFNGITYITAGTYLVFLTNSTGCDSVATLILTVKQPTTSTINISICNGSSYVFNGTTYSTSGTYIATLTNSAGCDSIATLNLTVSSVTQPTLQAIAGTSAVCPGDSTVLTDATLGGIWTVDSLSVATVDSITGLVKGLVQGSVVVSYTVGTPGTACSATVSVPFTVNCDVVASGSTGGLESKGLGDAVAKRVYNAALSNTDSRIDYSRLSPVKTNNIIQVMGNATPGNLTLSDLMPAKESIGCGYKTYDMSSHVTDLTGITNASAVETYDYVVKNETQSVTFLTRTYSNIYAHTKPICDRLKEAKLLDIQQVGVQGMTFIQYKLEQNDGKIEYAISFSAGVKHNDNKFNIQSIWLTRNYAIQDTMYNFQVWAIDPSMAKNMVGNILTKLNAVLPVSMLKDTVGIPSTYIRDITRTQNKLIMNIRNNTSSTNGTVNLTVRSNENMTTTSPMSVDVALLPNAVTPVSIDVKDSYESDISLLVDNNLRDMVYMNDGNWNYSLSNASNTPNSFTINNDGIMPDSGEYRLFRNVTIDVNVPDYVSIYKMMKAGGLSRDVSDYKQLLFKAAASNSGKMVITIQKASIVNWNEQYTYTMPVGTSLKDYAVNLRDFTSTGSNDTLTADDVVTVTFSFIGNGNNNHIVASLADVKFAKATSIIQNIVEAKNMNVYPNPAIERFNVSFLSDKNAILNMQLVDMGSGKVLFNKQVYAVIGANVIPVIVNNVVGGHYVLMLGNETIRYNPFKIGLNR